jgi:hypothetical protein
LRPGGLPRVTRDSDQNRGQGYPWTTLAALKGDPEVLRRLEETEKLLKDLRKTLSKIGSVGLREYYRRFLHPKHIDTM